ncbi:methylated-DNA--[protein]-cysteine S-methyltransferase [Candidatus Thiothrix sp. Deng01]|uniref:Methylated-DNA--protein-cysteine methyltransferase n=1 Tax=Candidatus Thiothrix phosphatis TaxID=3112415 RepID=A0ABU6D0B1_9GAMM|nr:methylated-DNA--[protein]-cysteine S-methyltransferase [Candidatus Thiothrix sp. Deng01]MEB4592512.1 methylated-DNA--[protein]-cysteine S-methyltransferase [Candidatus Thiothrix sp. Deng01]
MGTCFQQHPFPCGELYIAADEHALRAVAFTSNWARINAALGAAEADGNSLVDQAVAQLQEYFAGRRRVFDLPLQMDGTPFQRRAWQALQDIPYGETRSYAEQAALLGQPQAVRAVGHANGLNPLSIVVPCHRVIAKSGKLAGYAGGLACKQFLLALESGEKALNFGEYKLSTPCKL